MTRRATLPTRPLDVLETIQHMARRIRDITARAKIQRAERRRASRRDTGVLPIADLASIGSTADGIYQWADKAIRALESTPRTSSSTAPAVFTVTIGHRPPARYARSRERRLPLITYEPERQPVEQVEHE